MGQWGKYLLSQIEGYAVSAGSIAFWSIGGAGVVVKTSSATIYIDPYFGPSSSSDWIRMIASPIDPNQIRVVDAVISTHEHGDHCEKDTLLPICNNTNALFIGPPSSTSLMSSWGIPEHRLITLKPYESLKVKDSVVTGLLSFDPRAKSALTYIIEEDDVSVFHSGDSKYFGELSTIGSKFNIDVAFLNLGRNPPGITYYMTPCDVVRAARDLKAKIVIPIHWDIWKNTMEDPGLVDLIRRKWGLKFSTIILRLGDMYDVKKVSKPTSYSKYQANA